MKYVLYDLKLLVRTFQLKTQYIAPVLPSILNIFWKVSKFDTFIEIEEQK